MNDASVYIYINFGHVVTTEENLVKDCIGVHLNRRSSCMASAVSSKLGALLQDHKHTYIPDFAFTRSKNL